MSGLVKFLLDTFVTITGISQIIIAGMFVGDKGDQAPAIGVLLLLICGYACIAIPFVKFNKEAE